MLSRTAESLFWTARYIERAETMARLLSVGYRLALMPSGEQGYHNEWASILSAAGSAAGFAEKYGETIQQRDVETWLFFDRDNPSSVASCVYWARNNARAVRTAVTSELWDALNGAFQEFKALERQPRSQAQLPRLVDWTKRQSALVRGAAEGTLLQKDGYDFLNLGYYIERADNTARLVDVKYYVLLPTTDMVGGEVDNMQWSTLLRALSAYRAFYWAYGSELTAGKIAHFLILNAACPRSLHHCVENIEYHLNRLGRAYHKRGAPHEKARAMLEQLAEAQIRDIILEGLHEFLTDFIGSIAGLSEDVSDFYLFGAR